ncbi:MULTISPECIES: kynureninase [unclassified Arthrobacter]|uniref:kynureninase n=1 Tax=unclassified Arthrobacter TaxID=235627 RepID=UPI00159DF9B4|nr:MULTISPECIES: kynureninase [unclassified Arthrobacter]MCQ9162712.1 kynureninase [Arthrobacter sp. STN4]NVM97305.1 kynureninase [Arthrobacter sp. SDTb3-6]
MDAAQQPAPPTTREACLAADAADPLRRFRDDFLLPGGVIYLDGNSLGARPKASLDVAARVLEQEWGTGLIRSWNTAGWFGLPGRLGDKLAALVGAGPGEVVVTDTTSLNLFKSLAAALRIQQAADPARKVIVTERDNFPTDIYMAEGIADFLDQGHSVRLIDADLPLEDALGADVAVVALSHVNYRTGAMWDMASTTSLVHDAGALVVWDLAHAAGAVPVDLRGAGADFAVGCTYKYLNGGPGSPAFIWVNARHQDRFWQPLSGWWGHARPFAMEDAYEPVSGIGRFLCGTQPVVSMALVECGLDISLAADIGAVREKSLALAELFIALVDARRGDHPLELVTPRDPGLRGSHVSYAHPEGYAVMQALIARGVIGDYREPHVLRFGITPLYLGRADIWDAVEALFDILDNRLWDAPQFRERLAVT